MNQEIMTRQNGYMAQSKPQHQEVLRTDILVPYLVLVQELSDLKKEGLAKSGDICRNKSGEKYGDTEVPADVVFLHYPKTNWLLEEKPMGKARFEYRKTIERNALNENLAWSFWADMDGNEVPPGTRGATEWKRVKQMSVFGLSLADILAFESEKKKAEQGELPDPSKALTPFIISFRGSSYQAGKEVTTFDTAARSMGVPIWRYALQVGSKLVKDEDNQYYVWSVNRAKPKPVPKELVSTVEAWVNIVTSGGVKVDEEPVPVEEIKQPLRNYAPGS